MILNSIRPVLLGAVVAAAFVPSSALACDMHGFMGSWGYQEESPGSAAARAQIEAERIASIQRARQAFLSRFPGAEVTNSAASSASAPSEPEPLPAIGNATPTAASYPR